MQPILLPSKINFKKGAIKNETIVSLEPCYHGYGITIGNALRRVLLSSLPGSAITAVKIEGVSHEFSAIPNILEDVLQVILNLKQVRLVSHSSEPVKLSLKVSGEKKITAGDFEKNSDITIASPDQYIATSTDPKSEFKMEVIVEQGRGYTVTEERDKSSLEAGMIAIDSIFTPVKNVAVKVENVRVGQITNFDKLLLTVETDGTITSEEAVKEAAKVLIDHFNIVLAGKGSAEATEEKEEATEEVEENEEKEEVATEEEVE